MKQQLPTSEDYQNLLTGLRQQLKVLGYSKSVGLLSGAVEFLRLLESQGITNLSQVTSGHLKTHYAYLLHRPSKYGRPLSDYTITGYLYEIGLLFTYALKRGLIQSDPFAALSFPRGGKKERTVLSSAEIKRLYAACRDTGERVLLSLLYGCGLRSGEAQLLNIRDVDLRSKLLYVRRGKGRKRRAVPMAARVISDLRAYRYELRPEQVSYYTTGDHAKAFMLNTRGRRMLQHNYWINLRRLLKRSGETELLDRGVCPHVLRHSIATHLLADGMRLERVRDFLGHDRLETTQIYTRVRPEQLQLQVWI